MGIRSTVALVLLLAACGDNLKPDPDVDTTVVVALETTAPAQVTAGDTINVSCTLLENDITTMVDAEVRVVNETSVIRMGASVIARTVGTIEVSCALPDRGIVDPTPAIVEILTGPAANVVTTITPDPVVAGNVATATCEVYDAYGNPVDDAEPTLQLSPSDAANTVTDLEALMTRAGHYTARCVVPGTTSNNAGFDVIPNLPATLLIARWPDAPVYAVGSAVEITHIVTDRYGNEIPGAAVTKTVTPITGVGPVVPVAASMWRFDGEGLYRVDASVDPPTDDDVALTAQVEILVNSRGPAISCVGDATMINMTPGATMTVNGSANDVNGVASVTVNGTPVAVDQDGSFSAQITTRFGMNFVNVYALDTFDEPTTKVCTFLVSNRYANPANPIADAVSLKLTQPAIDDNNRVGAINSFGDLLHTILNSAGLKATIHNTLLAANPLKPHSCDYQTCAFGVCVCWYSSGVEYKNSVFPGPNTVSLTLVNGGLRARVRIPNISIYLRVWGRVSGIPYDTEGWVDVSYVDVDLILDTYLTNNQPRVSVRAGSVSTSVGTITTRFSGIDGWIINNVVVPLAQGSLRDLLRDAIQNFVTNSFNTALDGVMSSLDISTLGTTFNVPRIDGTGTVPMSFGLAFTTLNATTARLLFGIGTRFTTTAANAYQTLGVPLPPPNTNLFDGSVSSPANTAVAAHVGVFNGALHALWRANYFGATLDSSSLPALPSGVSLAVTTRLPPVALISGSTVHLHLGALDLVVQHPDLPVDLGVTLGADAHATVTLVGNDLVFGGIVIDELHVSTDAVDLTPADQDALEDALIILVQQLIDQSLNNALPALPIPTFTIPSTLSQFGLPANAQLGVNNPALTIQPQHFVLRGQFGIK
jgi:hypothetical protein